MLRPSLFFVSTLDKARSWQKEQSILSGFLARYLSRLGLLTSLGRFCSEDGFSLVLRGSGCVSAKQVGQF
jgi:hypothetical protein